MPDWPSRIPPDLRASLDTQNTYRDRPSPQDTWTVFLEWLQRHHVEAPDTLPTEPEQRPDMDQ